MMISTIAIYVVIACTGVAAGVGLGALLVRREDSRRNRARRALAVHMRMETEWKSARMRMHLPGPVDNQHMPGTKYSNRLLDPTNASTN